MTRRFELVEGASSKFWEITQEGSSFTVRYGRVGSQGQTQTKDFPSEAQARAAAAKLIAEKTGKGYAEVAAAPAEAKKPAEAQAKPEAKAKAEPRKQAVKTEKAEKKEVPPFALLGGKSLGARALANAAERFSAATTPEAWQDACSRISSLDHDIAKVLLHLLAHGLFTPTHRLHVTACRKALLMAPPEIALPVLSGLGEPLVETVRTGHPIVMFYVPVLARLHRLAPEPFRAAALPPTFARAAQLVRALAGESLDAEEGARAVAAIVELLPYGARGIEVVDDAGNPTPADPDALGAALARIGGPRWIRSFPSPDRLPAAVAIPALRDEPLEQVGRALSLFNKEILDARTEPPARFFEVAATLEEQNATFMRAAGIRRAAHPDEIPAGGEDLLAPIDVQSDPGFAKLGTARLDAWAARWLERFPNALTATEPEDEAYASSPSTTSASRPARTSATWASATRSRTAPSGSATERRDRKSWPLAWYRLPTLNSG